MGVSMEYSLVMYYGRFGLKKEIYKKFVSFYDDVPDYHEFIKEGFQYFISGNFSIDFYKVSGFNVLINGKLFYRLQNNAVVQMLVSEVLDI